VEGRDVGGGGGDDLGDKSGFGLEIGSEASSLSEESLVSEPVSDDDESDELELPSASESSDPLGSGLFGFRWVIPSASLIFFS